MCLCGYLLPRELRYTVPILDSDYNWGTVICHHSRIRRKVMRERERERERIALHVLT